MWRDWPILIESRTPQGLLHIYADATTLWPGGDPTQWPEIENKN